jgi:hypothetical protein
MADTLFGATADLSPETVTPEVIKSVLLGGKDPRTTEWWPDEDYYDSTYPGNARVGDSVEIKNLGTITLLATWGETKDETDVGQVWRHEETGKVYLATGTYSSWDGDHIDTVVEAEEYTFTEQRWRAV